MYVLYSVDRLAVVFLALSVRAKVDYLFYAERLYCLYARAGKLVKTSAAKQKPVLEPSAVLCRQSSEIADIVELFEFQLLFVDVAEARNLRKGRFQKVDKIL